MKKLIIAVDFDGTCVTHDFPKVGKDIGAVPVLKRLVAEGHKLILWTMRSNSDTPNLSAPYLEDAVNWFEENGIELYGCQCNPTQREWTTSPKCYAQLYIDDAALGAPVIMDTTKSDRPFINWDHVLQLFELDGTLTIVKNA